MLGDNIKQIRKSKNFSINKLSKLTGISLGYLSDLENNNAKNPTMEKLLAIGAALEVNIKDLLNSDEKLNLATDSLNRISEITESTLSSQSMSSYQDTYNMNNLNSIAMLFKDECFTENEKQEIINYINHLISKRY